MTRGKMILIKNENNKLVNYITCEFNGDMYLSYHGKNVVNELEKINTYEDFDRYVRYFYEQNFEYEEDYFGIYKEDIKDKTINVFDNYFDNWFSDYLYFKNASGEDIKIIYEKENKKEETIIKNGEISVFYFGELVDYKQEIMNIILKEINKKEV